MKHALPFTVRVYECGPDGKILISALINYMQEIAASHTVALHITIPELLTRGYTWMLSRYHMVIDRYPAYMDPVLMASWIARHEGFFSIRDFQLTDAQGNSLARITSSWVLYDLKEKKIAQVDKVLPLDTVLNERAVEDPFPTLPLPESTEHERQFHVRLHDLDINRHVNNRITVEWALEAVPQELVKTHALSELEITFKGQAFYGDMIASRSQFADSGEQLRGLHHIINMRDGQSIARARTRWKRHETQ